MKLALPNILRGAGLLSIATILFVTASAFAAENGGIGGKPANPRADNPRTESIFVYELQPGQSAKDAVEIYNNTEEPKNIKVYATDSVISSGGAFACAQAADPIKDVGGWIKLEKDTVSLQAGKSEKVGFTVNIPDYAEPGEHNGCIAIQEADAEAANVGNGIALSFRSAIRVAITVPGEIKKELTIREVKLVDKTDKLVGTTLLRNGGNVSLDTAVEAKLKSMLGSTAQTIAGTYPALPQTVTELNFEYEKPFWGGFYKLDTTATYNSNTDDSLGQGTAAQTVAKSSNYVYITPAPLALIVELLVFAALAVGVWMLWRRFVTTPRAIKSYADYVVKEDDDIQSIATKVAANWKHIAHVNKLKAPYLLKVGDVIKVPKTSKTVHHSKKTTKKLKIRKPKQSAKKED